MHVSEESVVLIGLQAHNIKINLHIPIKGNIHDDTCHHNKVHRLIKEIHDRN